MYITLIYLPHPFLIRPNMHAPLGLLYVAASLEERGHTVQVKNYSGWKVEDAVLDVEEADLYGITVTSLELELANQFASDIKKRFPKGNIVLGGPGTGTPEFIDWTVIDTMIVGEGEQIIHSIVDDLLKRRPLKRKYLGNLIVDIDSIPLPARHLLQNEFDAISVVTSRGCPFNCAFCASPFLTHRKTRHRSVDNVVEEIRELGAQHVVLSDDMFTANRERMLALCRELGKLDIQFRINMRARPIDMNMLYAARDAGCIEAAVGIESFDNNVLSVLNKRTTVADNVNVLWMLDKAKIDARIFLMIRTPGQTANTMRQNKYWLKQIPYCKVSCFVFVPIPGCDVWFNPDRYNIEILDKDLSLYNYGFYDSSGEIPLMPLFKLKDRSLEEFHKETLDFKQWLIATERTNAGDKPFVSNKYSD